MTDQANIHRIIEQAKQQRAEFIGTSIRKHPVAALLLVAIPVLLTQSSVGSFGTDSRRDRSEHAPRTPIAAPERLTEMLGESSAETFFSPSPEQVDQGQGEQRSRRGAQRDGEIGSFRTLGAWLGVQIVDDA